MQKSSPVNSAGIPTNVSDNPPIGWKLSQSYADLPGKLFSPSLPTPVVKPDAVLINYPLAKELGLNINLENIATLTEQLAGNTLPEGSNPIAQAYMGHQFGYLNMLGDGRAILLGEQLTPNGQRCDIQLKGAGPTAYSRRGDGRATLGACLREYIHSEAMHHLGIPTSRSLAVVSTGQQVYREQVQAGGVLPRVMSSHIRVGTFEFATRHLDKPDFLKYLQYVIDRHYPALKDAPNPAISLLEAVMQKQANLIANWMRVGFIHGVMNTDNMSIAGETFDYGPCAYMNRYDPATVFSSIDTGGRYAFGNQPSIAQWNLAVLASSLIPLIDEVPERAVEQAKAVIQTFPDLYAGIYKAMMQQKLGFLEEQPGDTLLINDLLQWMQMTGADYTNTFRHLSWSTIPNDELYGQDGFKLWHERWKERISLHDQSETEALALMQKVNPAFIPRNHLVEEAIDAATQGQDFSFLHKLISVLSDPYSQRPGFEYFQQPPAGGDGVYRTFCNT
jgi:uncharacterized protein YdiU (UPF0061 family)